MTGCDCVQPPGLGDAWRCGGDGLHACPVCGDVDDGMVCEDCDELQAAIVRATAATLALLDEEAKFLVN